MAGNHQFLVMLHDYKDPEALNRRLATREEHLDGARRSESEGKLLVGGAILDDHESSKMKGSFLLISAKSVEEVNDMIINDPYYKAKAWEKWDVYPVKCMDSTNKTSKNTSDKRPASLKQILERSKLTNSKIIQQELPAIKRGLNQINSQAQKLSAKTAANDEKTDIRAHYFLAQGGVNTQILIKEMGTIHLGGLEEHRQPIHDTNVEGYLQQQNTETVMKIVQDGRQEIIADTNDTFEKNVDEFWDQFITNTVKALPISTTHKSTKPKLNQSRIVSAGIIQ
ncbi:hypothetical protein [Parasitella parasitica]|uniref:YCII-related domain-containing protein n=1 Tax=Parasitella parasitica TaxID=35722 RepID=A0A0B7MTQ4_9FUNG|nr:hypothetical protein [Parasitella parasitica]